MRAKASLAPIWGPIMQENTTLLAFPSFWEQKNIALSWCKMIKEKTKQKQQKWPQNTKATLE